MALIRFGNGVADARGSISGTTFSRNRSGSYARGRVTPINPQTARQTDVRALVTALQAAFRDTLTAAQRAAWLAAAKGTVATNKLGDSITLTPQNLYIRTNVIVGLAGQTRIDAAPVAPATCGCPSVTYAGNTTDGLQLTAAGTGPGAGTIMQIQISPRTNPTVNFYKGPWDTPIYEVGAITPPVTLIANTLLTIGDRYHIRTRFVDADGRVSDFRVDTVDIAA